MAENKASGAFSLNVSSVMHFSDLDTDPIDGSVHTYCGLDRQPDAAGFRASSDRKETTCRRCLAALHKGLV